MIKGIIFDYGGTLDSRGIHWSEVLWDGYRKHSDENPGGTVARVNKEQFREAYVYAERYLARERVIMPEDNFATLLSKKVAIELDYMIEQGWVNENEKMEACANVTCYCDARARECVNEARGVLSELSERYPMMLVSNFYGNIDSVVREYDIRRYFRGIIESAVVGVRKPNPTLFRLGVDALELEPGEVLVVGDSLTKDIRPAESVGCRVLWLKGKGWTPEEDALTHPCMITSVLEVPERVAAWQA